MSISDVCFSLWTLSGIYAVLCLSPLLKRTGLYLGGLFVTLCLFVSLSSFLSKRLCRSTCSFFSFWLNSATFLLWAIQNTVQPVTKSGSAKICNMSSLRTKSRKRLLMWFLPSFISLIGASQMGCSIPKSARAVRHVFFLLWISSTDTLPSATQNTWVTCAWER